MNGSFREEPSVAGRGCSSSTGRAQMKVRKGLVWQCERRRVCWGGAGGAGGGDAGGPRPRTMAPKCMEELQMYTFLNVTQLLSFLFIR